MRMIKKSLPRVFLFSGIVASSFFVGSFVLAQEELALPVPIESENSIIGPTIDNVQVVSQDGELWTISLDMIGGQQMISNIRYGIQLHKADIVSLDVPRDTFVFDEVFSLAPGEKIRKEFSYTPPASLEGDHTLFLSFVQENGRMLSMLPLDTVSLKQVERFAVIEEESCFLSVVGEDGRYNLHQGVDVDADAELLRLSCALRNTSDQEIRFVPSQRIFERSVFGREVGQVLGESKEIGGEKTEVYVFDIEIPSAPQAYSTLFSLESEDGARKSNALDVHFVVQGVSATIQGFDMPQGPYQVGGEYPWNIEYSGSADGFYGARSGRSMSDINQVKEVSFFVADASSKERCGSEERMNASMEQSSSSALKGMYRIDHACAFPVAHVTLYGKDGRILASDEFLFFQASVADLPSQMATTDMTESAEDFSWKNGVGYGIFILIFLLVIAVLWKLFARRKSGMRMFIFFLVLCGSMGISMSAQAGSTATHSQNVNYDANRIDRINWFDHSMRLTFTGPSGNYPTGTRVSVTGKITNAVCKNSQDRAYWSADLHKVGQAGIIQNIDDTTVQGTWKRTNSMSKTFRAINTPGDYYVSVSWRDYGPGHVFRQHAYKDNVIHQIVKSKSFYFSIGSTASAPTSTPTSAPSFQCTGATPTHAQLCSGDDTGLTADTPKTLVASCISGTKCKYICDSPSYVWNSETSSCVSAPTVSNFEINGAETASANEGDTATFTWSSTNADQCTITGGTFNSSSLQKSGVEKIAGVTEKGTYTVTCSQTGVSHTATDTATLSVTCTEGEEISGWTACPSCDQEGDAEQTRLLKTATCGTQTETKICNIPKCQPDGFKEVNP